MEMTEITREVPIAVDLGLQQGQISNHTNMDLARNINPNLKAIIEAFLTKETSSTKLKMSRRETPTKFVLIRSIVV